MPRAVHSLPASSLQTSGPEGEPLPSAGRGAEPHVCLVVLFLTLCPSSGPDPASWNQGALSSGTPEEKGHFPQCGSS